MHNIGENQGCGGTKNLTAGPVTLASVDMDRNGKYDDNLDCQWLLIAPEFRSVEITFNAFYLEGSQGLNKNADGLCPFDYIEVWYFVHYNKHFRHYHYAKIAMLYTFSIT